MASSVSVAQFMAFLTSGGGQSAQSLPSLKGKTDLDGGQTISAEGFESFMAQLGDVANSGGEVLVIQQNPQGVIQEDLPDQAAILQQLRNLYADYPDFADLTSFQTNLNGEPIVIAKSDIDPETLQNGLIKAVNVDEMIAFIEANAGGLNADDAVRASLSLQGVPDDVIDQLEQVFSTDDLVKILTNPQQAAQLNRVLQQADFAGDANALTDIIDTVQTLLLDDQEGLQNLTFKETELPDDAVLKILTETRVTGDILNETGDDVLPVILITVVQDQQPRPVKIAAVQQQITVSDAAQPLQQNLQPIPASSTGENPFLQGQADGDTVPQPLQNAADQTQQSAQQNAYQSIADRLASQTTAGQQSQGGMTLNETFIMDDSGQMLMLEADGSFTVLESVFKAAPQSAHSLLNTAAAGQPHPVSQAVATTLHKIAGSGRDAGAQEDYRYRLQLDPPELGRLDIEMDFLEGGKIKAVITVDKPETLGMLQKDMHTLLKAMQDAGFEATGQNDLSFTLSQGQDQNGSDGQGGSRHDALVDADLDPVEVIEAEMSIIIDPVTGQKSVNMLV